jgi:hypothetical protein
MIGVHTPTLRRTTTAQLVFTAEDDFDHVDQLGNLFAILADTRTALPTA